MISLIKEKLNTESKYLLETFIKIGSRIFFQIIYMEEDYARRIGFKLCQIQNAYYIHPLP